MSGRAKHWRDGELVTNRKTDRRQAKRLPPDQMPDWRLTFLMPASIAFSVSPGPTGVLGVTVLLPGPMVEARGKNRDWVLQQASTYLGQVAGGVEIKTEATLERGDDPPATEDAPAHGKAKYTREMVYVPGASVVFLHPAKGALVFPVKR